MKKVYLIRHGKPDFPDGKHMCLGRTDLPLSPEGLSQAREMAKILPTVSSVFSSPLIRAVQTAQAIGRPITILDDLREMDAGDWDGLTFDEIRTRYPQLYAARGQDPSLPLPGGEDRQACLSRFRNAMEIAAQSSSGDLAVTAHGAVIAAFMESLGAPWRKPGYAQIVTVFWNNGYFSLQEETADA